VALLDGQVGIDSFTDQRRFSPDMEETLAKILVEPGLQESDVVKATAHLKNGDTVSEECRGFRGSLANPMSREERMDKIRDCFRRVLTDRDGERLLALLEDLENLADVSDLMQIVGQGSSART
jgi:aconitate decarboxylase